MLKLKANVYVVIVSVLCTRVVKVCVVQHYRVYV